LIGILALFLYATEPARNTDQTASTDEPFTAADWQRIAVIVIISLFSILFWMGFEQSGGTLNLFADGKTNRTILGYNIPASVFQAVNPVFIITLAPLFAALWTYLSRRHFPLPSVAKQGLGLILLGVAFGVMYFADQAAGSGPVSSLWLIAVYFIFTVAELFISPIGLSLVNKLAHPRVASLMMAFWFLCTAAANYLAGIMEKTLEPYDLNLWAFLGVMALVPGVLMLALTPVLVKMSHGRV
jgi:POT family proton-dependent oligopeptide transporter